MAMAMAMATATPKKNNIVVIGGGIQGTSVAYHLSQQIPPSQRSQTSITILESKSIASAASGKGGGFMARSWGDGSPTQRLHEVSFDMYNELATTLGCTSYRQLPVLSVTPGYTGVQQARKDPTLGPMMPSWLDGQNVGRISPLGYGNGDTAQITPYEFVTKMIDAMTKSDSNGPTVNVVLGTCTGIETDQGSQRGSRKVTAVQYKPRRQEGNKEGTGLADESDDDDEEDPLLLPADVVVVSAGPWSCQAEDWFYGAVQLPMEGIKSTSIVWKNPLLSSTTSTSTSKSKSTSIDGTALFCGEHDTYHTHLEVYPRPDGTIYLCGIGGSDYITTEQLKSGAFREQCDPNEARVDAAMKSFQEMSSLYDKEGELDKTQACMRPCPPDAMPYMGIVPGYEGAYINAGHNCWGIAWAPACGRAMAELILDGQSKTINLTPFDPARFTVSKKKGGRGRKRQGTSVGEQW